MLAGMALTHTATSISNGTVASEGKIAVLLPCCNEAITIDKVVRDFRRVLPDAEIYMYDHNSTDWTAEITAEAGAIVRTKPRQGKAM